ncbi:MAG: DUF4168 domain-containing protein [Bacteroidota bacterium]|nr:DUF4168 domain-containing protein [Bacteroidota bacterium]
MHSQKKEFNINSKYITVIFAIALLFSFNVNAQDETFDAPEEEQTATSFNDEELQLFANAAGKVIIIQQETEEKMLKAIEGENIELEKFNAILKSQQSQEEEAMEASEDEMQSFNNAAEKIIQIQTEVQSEMIQAIQDEGLEPQKYEQIMLAYQSDPEVKARIDSMLHNTAE